MRMRALAGDVDDAVVDDDRCDESFAGRFAVVIQFLHFVLLRRCRCCLAQHSCNSKAGKKCGEPGGEVPTRNLRADHMRSSWSMIFLQTTTTTCPKLGQGKSKYVAAGRDRHVLLAIYCKTHRRSVHQLPCMEMPERCARLCIHRFKRFGIVAKKCKAASRGHRSARRMASSDLRVTPSEFCGGDVVGQQNFLRSPVAWVLNSSRVVCSTFFELLGLQKIRRAIFHRQEIKQVSCRIVGG